MIHLQKRILEDIRNYVANNVNVIDKVPKFLTFSLAVALFIYTFIRAKILSMTHDESGSFLYWMDFPIYRSFFEEGMWPDANLHWLYVLSMKGTTLLFGNSELAIRLPSIFAHSFYLFFSWKILSYWSKNNWIVLIGFVVMNSNLYLLDFYSLARGYGLSITLMIISLYYFGVWLKEHRIINMYYASIAAVFACLANMTCLNYFASLFGVFSLCCLCNHKILGRRKTVMSIIPVFKSSIILFLLLRIPINGLRDGNKLYFGADTLIETFYSIIENSLYDSKPFKGYTMEIVGIFLFLLASCLIVLSFIELIKQRKKTENQFHASVSTIVLFVLIGTYIQNKLFGTPFLHHRTSLFLFPLFGLIISLGFKSLIEDKNFFIGKIVAILFASALLLHTIYNHNFIRTREWWFDSTTKDVVLYLDKKYQDIDYSLGCNWLYQPTISFYVNSTEAKFENPPYEKKVRTDLKYDFYYVDRSDLSKIHKNYVLEKQFSYSSFLMKNRNLIIDKD